MSTIQENLRATLLSLKQISDRLKSLNTTSVTKSEALAYKNEIISALSDIDFTEIIEALSSIDEKIDDISTELESVAQEATLGDVQDVLEYMQQGGMPQIAQIAKQGSNASATLSDTQTAATNAATDAAAAKTAAQGITGYALQGNDATATNTALAALIGYTIQEIDGI